jgi:hypothetical protein
MAVQRPHPVTTKKTKKQKKQKPKPPSTKESSRAGGTKPLRRKHAAYFIIQEKRNQTAVLTPDCLAVVWCLK